MQHTHIKKNGYYILIDWDNEGKIGVDNQGKVWKNINNPELLHKTKIPNDETFLKPLIDYIEKLKLKYK